jgi:hypothetical protein
LAPAIENFERLCGSRKGIEFMPQLPDAVAEMPDFGRADRSPKHYSRSLRAGDEAIDFGSPRKVNSKHVIELFCCRAGKQSG